MWGNCHFSAETSRADAELQFHMGFFEKTSVGLRYGGVLCGPSWLKIVKMVNF